MTKKVYSLFNGFKMPAFGAVDLWFMSFVVLLPVQFVLIGGAQLSQLLALVFLLFMFVKREIEFNFLELYVYLLFLFMAVLLTFDNEYVRIKQWDQVLKFVLIYPAFYLAGRRIGIDYARRKIPFGYISLWFILFAEYIIHVLEIPVVYQKVEFAQDAIHGSFKERNWFAVYFFFLSYIMYYKSKRDLCATMMFVLISVAVALLSESKSNLVCVMLALLVHARTGSIMKWIILILGLVFYIVIFGNEITGDRLAVRLEEERGLAFERSIILIGQNFIGYGFGFVEGYFESLWYAIRGLGLGTNSVFSVPLDLMIIAGVFGFFVWLVFFVGVGLGWRAFFLLIPVSAWSLLNPLHQSEIVYFFNGLIVSIAIMGSDDYCKDNKLKYEYA